MSIDDQAASLLEAAIKNIGLERAKDLLREAAHTPEDKTLTIIANQNAHHIPAKYLRGEVYVASKGNIDFSSLSAIEGQYVEIIERLKKKLMRKAWSKVYLIPTGHPTLSLQIKSAVYRITRLDTTDLFYSNGEYYDITINWRDQRDFGPSK